ncbi:MAG: alpha-mannosidase, partial [Chloroflexota bacterium]|nr:alpha-mannosidase [Chloroflexota bacterium]
MQHDIRLTAKKLARRLELIAPLVYRRRQPLAPLTLQALAGPEVAPPLNAPDTGDWPAIPYNSYWGGHDLNFALRGSFTVPADWDAAAPVALLLPLGDGGDFSHPEALAYLDGVPYATTDRHHQEFQLPATYRDGQAHRLLLHGWTGLVGGVMSQGSGKQLFMQECAVVQIDPPTRELLTVARTTLQAALLLDSYEPAKTRLYNVLDAAVTLLDTREPFGDAFYAGVPAALAALRAGIAAAGPPLDAEIIAAGHAHIDVAWLWTLGQTRRKAGRSFHTVLRLMEQFPDYHFTQSQPQLYAYIQQDYPELFAAIQARVAEGRWEPIGGMWVEADCNLSGPESLARQFLIGRTYFREQFGATAESPVLWLPDVFGYAWCLPQLIKLAGLEYFFTIKIGWNQTNKMPIDSFWWQGLDGSKVLTHFSTAPEEPLGDKPDLLSSATYNADLNAFSALGAWANLQHKEAQRVLLMSYGYGDGGGGPTREMNENAGELRAFPALPRLTQGKVIDFFRRLEAESGDQLPTWNSELYLEIHRGTYTTQSRNKRANRKIEFLLHDAEAVATLAGLLDPAYEYPHATFQTAWQGVCLNQFHDIIPGSSINAVYRESLAQYAAIQAAGEAARDTALAVIAVRVGGDVVVVNPTGFTRDDLILWPGELAAGQRFAGGVVAQAVDGGTLIGGLTLAPYSAQGLTVTADPADAATDPPPLHVAPDRLENAYIRVEIDAAGDITRIYDKRAAREVLPPGAVANQFQAFEDRPLNWDAWDIDIFYDDKQFLAAPAESIRVVESGPLRATLEIRRRILNSRYTQRLSLAYNSPQVDVDTTIDWRERHILLKVAFPVDVLAPAATYEIQWGSVQRPTHRNTSWDWARFETCAQKWVDLSEGDYGVALLNDCKYGHDIQANVIRLSLLRAPTAPDPEADQGAHRFAYSLYPHANPGGGLTPAQVAQRAYLLNDPTLAVSGRSAPQPPPPPLVTLPDHLIIETVKWAEDGNGIIVRFYECNRQRGPITVTVGFPLRSAAITNLLEADQTALPVEGQSVRLSVTPFQIVTVRLVP